MCPSTVQTYIQEIDLLEKGMYNSIIPEWWCLLVEAERPPIHPFYYCAERTCVYNPNKKKKKNTAKGTVRRKSHFGTRTHSDLRPSLGHLHRFMPLHFNVTYSLLRLYIFLMLARLLLPRSYSTLLYCKIPPGVPSELSCVSHRNQHGHGFTPHYLPRIKLALRQGSPIL